MTHPTPTAAGFYWAKWRIASPGTPEGEEQTPSDTWEVVDVFVNCNDEDSPEHLLVHVSGQAKGQAIENFVWGPGPLAPPDAAPPSPPPPTRDPGVRIGKKRRAAP